MVCLFHIAKMNLVYYITLMFALTQRQKQSKHGTIG
nr:MAG TPA: hypothetical protein [Caudoviricetes sp.]